MENIQKQQTKDIPGPIRFITFLYIFKTVFLSVGYLSLVFHYTPFQEMEQIANELQRVSILGFPAIPVSILVTLVELVAAIGLFRLKNGVYLYLRYH